MKSIRALFTYSSPLFTSLFRRICVSSYASMPRALVKSGEEWGKSCR
ncbi:MAG: hypothetical protein PUE09_06430 [Prevotella copri]|nr:hypothetical protein [Segatella copri]